MPRFLTLVVALLPIAFARGDVPAEVGSLQKTVHRLIDLSEPSVACILISRSAKYAEMGEAPLKETGKLGGFTPQRHLRFLDGPDKEAIKKLDLAHPDAVPEAYGSGVVIDPAGLVLTNYHVIQDATKIYVRLPGWRGSYADIVAYDGRADLAVLRLITLPTQLKALKFGDGSAVRKGDWVISLANPFAAGFRDGNPSASWGIISNVRRRAPGATDETRRTKPLAQYGTLLQTDARLNLGSSGGAIINLEGELVGLTTSLAAISGGETAGGYAIPLDQNFKKIIEVLKRGEEVEYGFLGVNIDPDENPDGRGLRIGKTPLGMPASRAGLQARDIITMINGQAVRDHDDLFLNVGTSLAGTEVEIEYKPGGGRESQTVKARLAKANHNEASFASNRPKPVFGLLVDYVSTLSIDSNPPLGVLIREKDLVAGSPAAKKLLEWANRDRLIIVAVNGKVVATPADFYRETAGKSTIELEIVPLSTDANPTRQKVTLP